MTKKIERGWLAGFGISNLFAKELSAVNEFGRLYHKHEKGGGGQFMTLLTTMAVTPNIWATLCVSTMTATL